MKIVIGYNDTEGARAALRDLKLAGLPSNCDATVLTALEDLPSLAEQNFATARSPDLVGSYQIDTSRLVTQVCEKAQYGETQLQEAFPGWNVQAKSRVGRAQWLLIREAEQFGADLVVIGSKGHSLLSRIAFGSTSHFVVNHAPCSVRVARLSTGNVDARPVKLMVGVDGSAHSKKAVEAVAQRQWPAGSEVRLVSAFDVELYEGGLSYEDHQAELHKALAAASDIITAAGVKCSTFIRPGFARSVLLEEAKEYNADCLFVGAIGHSLLDRLLIGSTSAAVAAEAPCTVEIVRDKVVKEPA